MKNIKFLILLMLYWVTLASYGADIKTAEETSKNFTNQELLLIFTGTLVVGVSILALLFCLYFLYVISSVLNPSASPSRPAFSLIVWLNEKFGLGKLKPIEEEGTIALNHSYDGIVELDNGMPPWLRYLFTSTIVFAIFYVFNYLIFDSGLNQTQEYEQELAFAEKQAAERKLLAANSLDENSVTLVNNEALIGEGKLLFEQNCRACHGAAGEGGVGPNLTDAYWLHGGKISDVFKSIKYGIPEKGMIAWQAKLKPVEIQNVASYIITLRGTNPPNGKAPQGDLFEEGKSVTVVK